MAKNQKRLKETEKYQPEFDESEESKESEKSETSDEEAYQRLLNKPKLEKLKIRAESFTTDWHESLLFSRAQLLAFAYTFDKFIKNPLHQPYSRECMQKLHENWIENPTWAENYKLEDIKFSII